MECRPIKSNRGQETVNLNQHSAAKPQLHSHDFDHLVLTQQPLVHNTIKDNKSNIGSNTSITMAPKKRNAVGQRNPKRNAKKVKEEEEEEKGQQNESSDSDSDQSSKDQEFEEEDDMPPPPDNPTADLTLTSSESAEGADGRMQADTKSIVDTIPTNGKANAATAGAKVALSGEPEQKAEKDFMEDWEEEEALPGEDLEMMDLTTIEDDGATFTEVDPFDFQSEPKSYDVVDKNISFPPGNKFGVVLTENHKRGYYTVFEKKETLDLFCTNMKSIPTAVDLLSRHADLRRLRKGQTGKQQMQEMNQLIDAKLKEGTSSNIWNNYYTTRDVDGYVKLMKYFVAKTNSPIPINPILLRALALFSLIRLGDHPFYRRPLSESKALYFSVARVMEEISGQKASTPPKNTDPGEVVGPYRGVYRLFIQMCTEHLQDCGYNSINIDLAKNAPNQTESGAHINVARRTMINKQIIKFIVEPRPAVRKILKEIWNQYIEVEPDAFQEQDHLNDEDQLSAFPSKLPPLNGVIIELCDLVGGDQDTNTPTSSPATKKGKRRTSRGTKDKDPPYDPANDF
jgi:hypothetical protein